MLIENNIAKIFSIRYDINIFRLKNNFRNGGIVIMNNNNEKNNIKMTKNRKINHYFKAKSFIQPDYNFPKLCKTHLISIYKVILYLKLNRNISRFPEKRIVSDT